MAEDGLLVRLRLVGGRVSTAALTSLIGIAEEFGDGRIHLTSRANLQVRGFPGHDGRLDAAAVEALESTGLLPTRTHELVRNIMVSPQSGLAGGRADLRAIAQAFDQLLCATPVLASLPGRFLFVFDDGRGDLLDRSCDLGFVALDADAAQLRVGAAWGEVVALADAPRRLIELASTFVDMRGSDITAPWHIAELAAPLTAPVAADLRVPGPIAPLSFGDVPGGHHLAIPDGLNADTITALAAQASEVIVTPWRGVLIPQEGSHD